MSVEIRTGHKSIPRSMIVDMLENDADPRKLTPSATSASRSSSAMQTLHAAQGIARSPLFRNT